MNVPNLTIEEIASGLSTIPRWTARTILDKVGARWSVLQHSLLCWAVAANRGRSRSVELLALLHDIEECLTGDTPKPWKTGAQSSQGYLVRTEMFRMLGVLDLTDSEAQLAWGEVHRIDGHVRVVEGGILLNPVETEKWTTPAPDYWREIADAMWSLIGVPPHVAVEQFVMRYRRLTGPGRSHHNHPAWPSSLDNVFDDHPFDVPL